MIIEFGWIFPLGWPLKGFLSGGYGRLLSREISDYTFEMIAHRVKRKIPPVFLS